MNKLLVVFALFALLGLVLGGEKKSDDLEASASGWGWPSIGWGWPGWGWGGAHSYVHHTQHHGWGGWGWKPQHHHGWGWGGWGWH